MNDKKNREPMVIALATGKGGSMKTTSAVFLACALVDQSRGEQHVLVADADALCELLNLSEEQRQYFTGVLPGQGLMKIGSAFVPFDGRIPSGGDLYRLYSTSFQEQEGK